MSRFASSVAAAVGLMVVLAGCLERNPHYDPDGGPACSEGERQCDPDQLLSVQLCDQDGAWQPDHDCWAETECQAGLCVPDAITLGARCMDAPDCPAPDTVCTVLVDPDSPGDLGTFCISPPVPNGRPGGQACDVHEQCLSGWCFRRICYEACATPATCTNGLHECALLDVTVEGVRDQAHIFGCVPPGSP